MKRQIDRYQVSLKAFIRNEKGEVLALKALETGTMAGYHDFPGGRIDADEFGVSFMDILAREIKEECGDIEFDLGEKPVAIARHLIPAANTKEGVEIHVLYVFFEAHLRGGEVKISDEHVGQVWLNLSKIKPEEYFNSGNLAGVQMYLR